MTGGRWLLYPQIVQAGVETSSLVFCIFEGRPLTGRPTSFSLLGMQTTPKIQVSTSPQRSVFIIAGLRRVIQQARHEADQLTVYLLQQALREAMR